MFDFRWTGTNSAPNSMTLQQRVGTIIIIRLVCACWPYLLALRFLAQLDHAPFRSAARCSRTPLPASHCTVRPSLCLSAARCSLLAALSRSSSLFSPSATPTLLPHCSHGQPIRSAPPHLPQTCRQSVRSLPLPLHRALHTATRRQMNGEAGICARREERMGRDCTALPLIVRAAAAAAAAGR